jgi:hypothetical protein
MYSKIQYWFYYRVEKHHSVKKYISNIFNIYKSYNTNKVYLTVNCPLCFTGYTKQMLSLICKFLVQGLL